MFSVSPVLQVDFFTAEPLGKSQQLGAIRKMTFGDYSSYY